MRLLVAALALALLAPTYGGSRGPRTHKAIPEASGIANLLTEGALSGPSPVVITIGTLADESDACTGTAGTDQTCVSCNSTGNSVCSFREAILDTRSAFILCSVAGKIDTSANLRVTAASSYKTFDAASCPGPLIFPYRALKIDARDVVIANMLIATAGDGVIAKLGMDQDTDAGGPDLADPWELLGGGSLDAIQVNNSSKRVLLHRMGAVWACDENLNIMTCVDGTPGESCGQAISVSRMLNGATPISSATYPCTGSVDQAGAVGLKGKGGLLGGTSKTNVVTGNKTFGNGVLDSLFAFVAYRGPWIGGSLRFSQNQLYDTLFDNADLRILGADQQSKIIITDNLWRTAATVDTDYKHDYCVGGTDAGRFCDSAGDCTGGGTCANGRVSPIHQDYWARRYCDPGSSANNDTECPIEDGWEMPRVYLSGNRVYSQATDTFQSQASPAELDADWDLVVANMLTVVTPTHDLRPLRNPTGTMGSTSGDSAAGGPPPGASYWRRRLAADPEAGADGVPARIDATTLLARSLNDYGPVYRTPIDDEIRATITAEGVYADLGLTAPKPYPVYTVSAPADTDADGIPDSWEQTNCGGSSPWCSPLSPATVSRCTGYTWVQCWAHRYAFGETITQVPATECSDYIDNDVDGLVDYNAGAGDTGCTSATDTTE